MNPEVKIDHLSWSQISLYLKNPREWWFKYVKYPNEKEMFDTWALELGREYHGAMEIIYKGGSLQAALDAYDQLEMGKQYKELEHALLRNNIEWYYYNIYPMYKSMVVPENVELAVDDFRIEGVDVPIKLRIDLLTLDDRIIDHKTVGSKVPEARGSGQGALYGLWFYKKYGKLPRKFELHRVYKNSWQGNPVDISEATISLADVLNMQEIIRGVWKSINAGIFYWGLDAYQSQYKDEYDNMLIMQG